MVLSQLSILCCLLAVFNSFTLADVFPKVVFTAPDFEVLDDHQTVLFRNPRRATSSSSGPAKLKLHFRGGNFTAFQRSSRTFWRLSSSTSNSSSAENINAPNINSLFIGNSTTRSTLEPYYSLNWWHHYSNTSFPQLCIDLSYNRPARWFATFLKSKSNLKTAVVPLMTGSGESQLGPVVDTVLFSSDGFAIDFGQFYPTYIQLQNDDELCISAEQTIAQDTSVDLRLDLFFAANGQLARRHFNANHAFTWKVDPVRVPEWIFNGHHTQSFSFDVKALNQSQLLKVIETHSGFKNASLVLHNWEAHHGDLSFDTARFPDPSALVARLHALGHRLVLAVSSFVSEHSTTFRTSGGKEFLMADPLNRSQLFTFSWRGTGGSLFDYSNLIKLNRARLERLFARFPSTRLGVDGYRFVDAQLGVFGADVSRRLHTLSSTGHYGNHFTAVYARFVARFEEHFTFEHQHKNLTNSIDAAYHAQDLPLALQMAEIDGGRWSSLKEVLADALTLNLAGYSFLLPPTFKPSEEHVNNKPSEELFIRWLQLTAFFPGPQNFGFVWPWTVSERAANLSRRFQELHAEHSSTMLAIAKEATLAGEPLLRPLWYLAPDDPQSWPVDDQFALGADLVVAPVLSGNTTSRSVYLPGSGSVWIDQHGKEFSGVARYTVLCPLEELPYFRRKL